MRRLSLAAALLAALTLAAPAQAQTKRTAAAPAAATTSSLAVDGPTMDNQVSVWGLLAWRYAFNTGVGLGARYQKILLPASKSLLKLPNIRDEIGVEGGIDFIHFGEDAYGWDWSYNRFDIVAAGVWNFWLNDRLAVYPKVELGFGFGSMTVEDSLGNEVDVDEDEDLLTYNVAAGAAYKMDRLFLRAELGSAMLRLGAGFNF